MTDNPGTWLLHCHVNKHFSSGMQVCLTLQDVRWKLQQKLCISHSHLGTFRVFDETLIVYVLLAGRH